MFVDGGLKHHHLPQLTRFSVPKKRLIFTKGLLIYIEIFALDWLFFSIKDIYFYELTIIFYLFIYLFVAVLGLCCCVWTFSSCYKQWLLFVAVCRLLIAVASLVVEHGI